MRSPQHESASGAEGVTAVSRTRNPKGDGALLRLQLIDAASELLLAPQEPTAPSLRAVARACSVSPTAVYRHFASQKELVWAVVEAQHAALAEHLAVADRTDAAPEVRLAARATAYASWGASSPGAYQLLFESADRLGFPHQQGGPNWDVIEHSATLLAAARSLNEQDALLWATRMWVALHGLVSLRIHKPDHEWPETMTVAAADIVALHLDAIPR